MLHSLSRFGLILLTLCKGRSESLTLRDLKNDLNAEVGQGRCPGVTPPLTHGRSARRTPLLFA